MSCLSRNGSAWLNARGCSGPTCLSLPSYNDAVELRFHSENESTERWSELTSTRYRPVALTCSGLGSSRSTSTESFPLSARSYELRILSRASIYCAILVFLFAINAGFPHDPGLSTAEGELRVDALTLTTGFAPADAEAFLPPAFRSGGKWTPLEFETVHEQLLTIAPQLWEVRSGRTLLTPRDVKVELLPGDNVSFQMV